MPRTQHKNMESENIIAAGSIDPGKETLEEGWRDEVASRSHEHIQLQGPRRGRGGEKESSI